jgi:hypothetical protein
MTKWVGLVAVLSIVAGCAGDEIDRGLDSGVAAHSTSPATTATTPSSTDSTTPPPTTSATSESSSTASPAPPTSAPPTTIDPNSVPTAPSETTLSPSSARTLLESIPVENEHDGGVYDRDAFGYGTDVTGAGCDTRQQVLAAESTIQFGGPCEASGPWTSLYDGVTVSDAALLEVDHVVALKETWDSGAWAWSPARMVAYANDVTDPRTLRAVTTEMNASKGDRDPSNWMPDDTAFWCTYASDWVAIKARWGLSMDESEWGRVKNVLADCITANVSTTTTTPPPVQTAPIVNLPTTTKAPSPPAPTTTKPAPPPPPPTDPPGEVYYKNCDAVRAAGAAPLYVGQPGYRSGLDRDGDGVACE